jgi:hypothetical protein
MKGSWGGDALSDGPCARRVGAKLNCSGGLRQASRHANHGVALVDRLGLLNLLGCFVPQACRQPDPPWI